LEQYILPRFPSLNSFSEPRPSRVPLPPPFPAELANSHPLLLKLFLASPFARRTIRHLRCRLRRSCGIYVALRYCTFSYHIPEPRPPITLPRSDPSSLANFTGSGTPASIPTGSSVVSPDSAVYSCAGCWRASHRIRLHQRSVSASASTRPLIRPALHQSSRCTSTYTPCLPGLVVLFCRRDTYPPTHLLRPHTYAHSAGSPAREQLGFPRLCWVRFTTLRCLGEKSHPSWVRSLLYIHSASLENLPTSIQPYFTLGLLPALFSSLTPAAP
jgi:hypothetical protein